MASVHAHPPPPPPPGGGNVTVVHSTTYQAPTTYFNPGIRSTRLTCRNCGADVMTRVEKKNGMAVWGICLGAIFFGFWLGCCLIPFCIDGLKDTEHYCPSCNALIAQQKAL